jgi:hypothetical protein
MNEADKKRTYSAIRHWALIQLKNRHPKEYQEIMIKRCNELGVKYAGRTLLGWQEKIISLEKELEIIKRDNKWTEQQKENESQLKSFLERLHDGSKNN